MKYKPWVRIFSLLMLFAILVGSIPMTLATDATAASSMESSGDVEVSSATDEPEISPEAEPVTEPQEANEPQAEPEPVDMNGETLTRHAVNAGGPRRARASSNGIVGKSICVEFSSYTSPSWHCNRYDTLGTHVYGHYYNCAVISYHTVDGAYAYCIEPNTSSINGATYYSYDGNSAASDSYWMLELDSWQRLYIQQILAFGYPSIDRGYSVQAQYAATQTLIWEVISKCRYHSGIMYSSDYGLFSKIYAVLGSPYQACYDGILASISSGISDGTVPSFASSNYGGAGTINLSLNSSTNCYEGSVTDSNGVLGHYTFSASGATFTKSGNTLHISVPASSAASIKGQTITGTSDQLLMSTSNPSVWENSTYQTVLSSGGADYARAYIRLNWEDTGSLKLVKKATDTTVSGWTFYFKNNSTGAVTAKTTGTDGIITLTGLAAGTSYTVSEKEYAGYYHPPAQTVTIQAGRTTEVTFSNKPLKGNLVVNKIVNYGTKAGFKFRLHGTSTIGRSVDVTAITDSNGKATFSNVYVGSYTLDEVSLGGQYVTPKSQPMEISANATTGAAYITTASMTNTWKYWRATVTKVDAETSTAQGDGILDGAEYTLYKSGAAVKTYTVKGGSFVTDHYPCTDSDSVYTLKETKAPPGYELDKTVYKLTTSYSHYTAAENNIKLTVSDQIIKGTISLEKWALNTVSGEKQPEKGATFRVWLKSSGSYAKAKATERDVITIGADGSGTSKDLPYGTYCVQQATTWDGYDLDTTVYERTIDGTSARASDTLSLHNDIWTGKLSICKVDGNTKEPLAGAEFTLSGTDDSEVVLVTDAEGKAIFENLVYGVNYVWAETKAPKGYLLDNDNTGTWSVSKHDDSVEITCENFRRPGSIAISKQNNNGEPLAGATFLLEYWDGTWKPVTSRSDNVVTKGACTSENLQNGQLTTDESGKVVFAGLWADDSLKYRLTEVAAPEGYELLTEPVFEGVLPVSYDVGAVTKDPDEVIDNTAYIYDLPITVHNGHIYTMPMTGGRNLPLMPMGIVMILLAMIPIILYLKNRRTIA